MLSVGCGMYRQYLRGVKLGGFMYLKASNKHPPKDALGRFYASLIDHSSTWDLASKKSERELLRLKTLTCCCKIQAVKDIQAAPYSLILKLFFKFILNSSECSRIYCIKNHKLDKTIENLLNPRILRIADLMEVLKWEVGSQGPNAQRSSLAFDDLLHLKMKQS